METPEELAEEFVEQERKKIGYASRKLAQEKYDAFLAGYAAANRWISVEEELPPEGRYLAYPNTVGEVGTALYWPKNNMWQDLEDHTEPWRPTYWQPLPPLPNK